MSLLLLAGVRHHLRHRLRTLLCAGGIALGVAVVLAMDLAIAGVRDSFERSVTVLAGTSTHHVFGGPRGVAESDYVALRRAGVRDLVPVLDAEGSGITPSTGSLRLLGIDPYAEATVRGYWTDGAELPIGRLLGEPNTVLVSSRLDVGVGERLTVRFAGSEHVLTVVGLFSPSDPAAALATERVLLVDIAVAQEVLRRPGWLSRLDACLDDASLEFVRSRLPKSLRIEAASERRSSLLRMVEAFELNLRFLSLLALVVGAFLIRNTMAFSVVERRPQFGRSRARGALPSEILRLVAGEALVFATIGGLCGVGLGWLAARGLVTVVGLTVRDLYWSVDAPRVSFDLFAAAKAIGVALGVTLVAALGPAWDAATAPPRAMGRRSDLEQTVRRRSRRQAWVGFASIVTAGTLLRLIPSGLLVCQVALLLLVIGFTGLVPGCLSLSGRAVRAPLGRLGFRGRLLAGNVISGVSRTGLAVAALAVALSMALGVDLMVSGFRRTVAVWLDQTLAADVYVTLDRGGAKIVPDDVMDPRVLRRLDELREEAVLTTNRTVDLPEEQGDARVVVLGVEGPKDARFDFLSGGERAFDEFLKGALLVSEPLARRRHWGVGSSVRFRTEEGWLEAPIAGVFRDYATERGYLVWERRAYAQHFDDPAVNAVALRARDGVDPETLVRRTREVVGSDAAILVRSQAVLREASLDVFDRTFAVTSLLQVLAVIVAFAGIVAALAALQLERVAEARVLEARGLTRADTLVIHGGEALLLGLAAAALAAILGTVFAAILTTEVNVRSFGWSLPLEISARPYAKMVVTAVAAAALAGLVPALVRKRSAHSARSSEEAR